MYFECINVHVCVPCNGYFRAGKTIFMGGAGRPGANVTKLFTAVIYHHSMVMLSFCVIKLYYPGNYRQMAVNYHGILTQEKVGLEVLR